MTVQQLYYEAATRIGTDNHRLYLVLEFTLKWKQVRGFVAVLAAIAFVASLFVPARYVYAFGVLALSALILMLPFLAGALAEVFARARQPVTRATAAVIGDAMMMHGGTTILAAVTVWAVLLVVSRSILGSLSEHLYVIPAAAFCAAVAAMLVSLMARSLSHEKRNVR